MLGTVRHDDASLKYWVEYFAGSRCPNWTLLEVLWDAEVLRPDSKHRSTIVDHLFHWTFPKDGQLQTAAWPPCLFVPLRL